MKKHVYISIFTKSVIGFLVLGLFPFLTISLFTFRKNMNEVTENAFNNAYQITKGIKDDVQVMVEDISEYSKYLYEYENEDYGYFYEIITNNKISDILKENLVKDGLKRILYRSDFINHVYFIGKDGRVYSSTRAPEKIVNQKEMDNWGKEAFIPLKNSVSIIPTHSSNYYLKNTQKNFTYVRNIMNTRTIHSSSKEILGTLYLDVSVDYFKNIIDKDKLMNHEHILIADRVRHELIYSNYNENETGADYVKIKKLLTEESGRFCLKADQMYFIGHHINNTNWIVVEKLPYSNLEKIYYSIIKTTVYLVLLSIALLAVLYYFNSKTISKPIRILKYAMEEIKAGNLETRVDIRSNDELGVLADGLNRMTEQLQKHIEKVYISEIRQREAQIKALMTQIQPHYLYNTLDTIRMSAITNDDQDTALMLESLSAQMRYLVGDYRSLVSLKEELDSIHHYFIIIKIRYENVVQLEINANDNTLSCIIPRLTLQPIIENSVKYGMAGKEGGTIAVFSEIKQDCLEITVIDDGVGMNEDTLAHVKGILSGDIMEERSGEKKFSIGLKNVEDRIRLQFGEDYGIEVSSTFGLGTLVRCRLPILYEKGDGR